MELTFANKMTWLAATCTLLLVCFNFQVVSPTTRDVNSWWDWGYGSSIWTAHICCTMRLDQDYPDILDPGFKIKLELEPSATGDIKVYYPFDQDAISVTDQGGKKVFVISTENYIVAYVGENYFTMQVKFDNSAQPTTQGNWPRGTCSGPYPLGASDADIADGTIPAPP